MDTMTDSMSQLESILASWQQNTVAFIPKVFLALLVLLLFYVAAKALKKLTLDLYTKAKLRRYREALKIHTDIGRLLSSLVYFFFLLSGVFLALQVLGLEAVLTKLLAGAGIVGIIAGFAFKDVASNIFAGLLLKTQQPFNKGDWVEIGDAYGVVTDVGWITTVIKVVPGQEVFVPNQVIYNENFTNYSTFHKRRIILESGVSYGDDLEHVKAVALDEVKKVSTVLADEQMDFYFTEIASSTYNFQLRFWIRFESNDDFQTARSEIIMRIKKRFAEENISIAYSVTTLDFGVKGGVNLFDHPVSIETASAADSKHV